MVGVRLDWAFVLMASWSTAGALRPTLLGPRRVGGQVGCRGDGGGGKEGARLSGEGDSGGGLTGG